MLTRHFDHWPNRVPKSLAIPETNPYHNLEVSAARYPNKVAIHYYGGEVTYRQLLEEVDALAGFLQQDVGVSSGDRVMLFMQNSPQFIIAYYAILRANAIVVPLNPMFLTRELAFFVADSEPKAAVVGQELYDRIAPLMEQTSLKCAIVAAYGDYTDREADLTLPDSVAAARQGIDHPGVTLWHEALKRQRRPKPVRFSPDDIVVLPYTSGTTGQPKGCIHTARTVQANTVGAAVWGNVSAGSIPLSTLSLFPRDGDDPRHARANLCRLQRGSDGPLGPGDGGQTDRKTPVHQLDQYQHDGGRLPLDAGCGEARSELLVLHRRGRRAAAQGGR